MSGAARLPALKYGSVSIGSSWLTKTLIDVFLSRNVVEKQNMAYFENVA